MMLKNYISNYKDYWGFAANFLFSFLLFQFAYLFHHNFHHVVDFASYLTWHNLFEFTSIVASFGIFVVTFFTYKQTRKLRSMFLGCVFFMVGILDFFHTLSFKGMAAFFISNDTANRATTLWIISSLVTSIGLFIGAMIPGGKLPLVRRRYLLIGLILFDLAALIITTYYPNLLPPMYIENQGLTSIKIVLEWVIILIFGITAAILLYQHKSQENAYTLWFVHALILRIFCEAAFTAYGSVYDIYNYLGHIYKLVATILFFRIMFVFNVQKPYFELTQARLDLEGYVNNLDKLVSERTSQLNEMNQKLMDDLEYAKDIQNALLPKILPKEPEVSFQARYFPAERVSGDFYNVLKLDEENVAIYIGDVSGHGVPAAMLTVFVNQSIKHTKENKTGYMDILMPSEVLSNLYYSFNQTNFKEDVYIVMFYAIYNFKARTFTYASGGLNALPLKISNHQVTPIQTSGFPICKFDEYYIPRYEDHSVILQPGDNILFYTDGLIGMKDTDGKCFDEKDLFQLAEVALECEQHSLEKSIEGKVLDCLKDRQLEDDVTFLIMKVH